MAPDSIYGILHRECFTLFPDEMFADLFDEVARAGNLAAARAPGGWKPFLHHVSKGNPQPRRAITVKAPRKLPRVLAVVEVQAILHACEHLRDRFLFALLWDSGLLSLNTFDGCVG